MLYILDTDHVTLLQHSHIPVVERVGQVASRDLAVTVVTVAEQMQGWLATIRRARNEQMALHPFYQLRQTVLFYLTVQVLPYTEQAVSEFARLRQQKIRIGTQDLRIAAIALSLGSVVVTRNARDFGQVPDLRVEDWST